MKKFHLVIFLILFLASEAYSQDKIILPLTIYKGDTMPLLNLKEVVIDVRLTRKLKRTIAQNEKLIRNVKRVMPYAKACRERLTAIDNEMAKIPGKEARKAFYEKAEAQLKEEFEGQLKKLSYSQGKLLIKLIDREVGKTPYKLIRQYKSSYSAMFWQSFATVFGMNLNKEYVVEDEKEIEFIIKWLGYN